jgi:hypothetical protein
MSLANGNGAEFPQEFYAVQEPLATHPMGQENPTSELPSGTGKRTVGEMAAEQLPCVGRYLSENNLRACHPYIAKRVTIMSVSVTARPTPTASPTCAAVSYPPATAPRNTLEPGDNVPPAAIRIRVPSPKTVSG